MGDLAMEEDRPILPSFAAPLPNPDPSSIRAETWVVADEPVREVLNCIHPTLDSDEKRKDVIEYVQKLIRCSLGLEVFAYGSVPLKTYLPDGDIDLTVLVAPNFDDILPREVLRVFQEEEQKANTEFVVKDTQFVDAEVKLVKCLVQDIIIDISFNQLGGLCTLCFLEQVDRIAEKEHLFKRSIILIKAWCFYESRILGAHHSLISTYALETLVLHIFHIFHRSLNTPAEVLYKFLDYYSKFDWENYCLSLDGPVAKSSVSNLTVENAESEESVVLLSGEFRKNCMDMFILPPKGHETDTKPFYLKHLNIIDPLKENNNLGRSVSRGNYYRIRSAFRYGARKFGRILQQPSENISEEIKKFFGSTLQRHKPKYGPDTTFIYPSKGFSNLSISSLSEEAFYDEDTHSKLSNGEYDEDYMNDYSTMGGSIKANSHSKVHSQNLTSDSSPRYSQFGNVSNDHNAPGSESVDGKTGIELLMEVGDQELLDGDTICLSDNNNNKNSDELLDNLSVVDVIKETDILNPFADLLGDYDAHIRNLLYGQSVHGYALSASMVRNSSPMSPYESINGNQWDPVAANSWTVLPFQQSSSSQVYGNGMLMGPTAYLNGSSNHTSADFAVRGTGPYIPVMVQRAGGGGGTRGRGRSRLTPVCNANNGQSQMPRVGRWVTNLVVETNHSGQDPPHELSPRLAAPANSESSNQTQPPTNQPRKLEFGSFRSSPANPSSPSHVHTPKLDASAKKHPRNGEGSFHLKNEEEFPPLSTA